MAPTAKAGAGLGIARLAHATSRRRDAAPRDSRTGAAGWARPCRQWGAMMLWRLWRAQRRSVGRAAVCHVTYPTNRAQNARQNAIQHALWHALGPRGACCGLSWGLPCPHVPCQAARASAPRAGAACALASPSTAQGRRRARSGRRARGLRARVGAWLDQRRLFSCAIAGAGRNTRRRAQSAPGPVLALFCRDSAPDLAGRGLCRDLRARCTRRRAQPGWRAMGWHGVGASWGARVVACQT